MSLGTVEHAADPVAAAPGSLKGSIDLLFRKRASFGVLPPVGGVFLKVGPVSVSGFRNHCRPLEDIPDRFHRGVETVPLIRQQHEGVVVGSALSRHTPRRRFSYGIADQKDNCALCADTCTRL